MRWSIRHQGSPQCVEDASDSQVLAGLHDGLWDAADEIAQSGTRHWVALERHPRFSPLVAQLEEDALAPTLQDPEEQRIDMNPLIDVCLVLLVFFILATTYSIMSRGLDLPTPKEAESAAPSLTPAQARERMILVKVFAESGRPVFEADDERVQEVDLEKTLKRLRHETRRTEVLLDAKNVDWGTVVKVIDAAAGADIRKVHFKTRNDQPASVP